VEKLTGPLAVFKGRGATSKGREEEKGEGGGRKGKGKERGGERKEGEEPGPLNICPRAAPEQQQQQQWSAPAAKPGVCE